MKKDADVILAQTAGFCPGVKKAIDCVLALAEAGKGPIYTLGPLIHNKQVIETLEAKGIRAVESVEEVRGKPGVLVLRAHGVTPELEREVRALGLEVVDSTCPLVKNVHSVICRYAERGYATVIVGDKGHAEVIGLQGYAGGKAFVVSGPEEARALPVFDKVNVVAQTTQEEDVFERTVAVVREKAREVLVSDTICKPTRDRQRETVELASGVDLMVIVGGKHSANTARLSALCRRLCPDTTHIETDEELDLDGVRRARRIGITAGASTPGWMTDRVLEKVRAARKRQSVSLPGLAERALEFLIGSCAYAGLSAVGLTYVCMKLQGCRIDDRLLVLAGLFVFSLHILNRVTGQGAATGENRKAEFVQRHRRPLIAAGVASGLGAMGLALYLDPKLFAVVCLCWLLGALYPFRPMRGLAGAVGFPGSRDIVTALGWGFVCAYLPGLHQNIVFTKANYLAVSFAVLLVFIRSVMLGISDVHSDMIVGRENFYKAMGPRTTHATLAAFQALLLAVLVALLAMGWKSRLVGALLLGDLLFAAGSVLYYARRMTKGFWAEAGVDGQFMLLALLTWLSGKL